MFDDTEQKQFYLRENILNKGYDAEEFMNFLKSKKGENGLDLRNWGKYELEKTVNQFITLKKINSKVSDNLAEKNINIDNINNNTNININTNNNVQLGVDQHAAPVHQRQKRLCRTVPPDREPRLRPLVSLYPPALRQCVHTNGGDAASYREIPARGSTAGHRLHCRPEAQLAQHPSMDAVPESQHPCLYWL